MSQAETKTPLLLEPAFFALRDLFDGPLRGASFPGVDASTLGELIDETERRQATLAAARGQLERAQTEVAQAEAALAQQRATLNETSHLALAYARVYAKDDGALLTAIDGIALPKPRPAGSRPSTKRSASTQDASLPPRRRGRPPKSAAAPASAEAAVVAAE